MQGVWEEDLGAPLDCVDTCFDDCLEVTDCESTFDSFPDSNFTHSSLNGFQDSYDDSFYEDEDL